MTHKLNWKDYSNYAMTFTFNNSDKKKGKKLGPPKVKVFFYYRLNFFFFRGKTQSKLYKGLNNWKQLYNPFLFSFNQ